MAFTVQGDGEPAGGIDTTLGDSTELEEELLCSAEIGEKVESTEYEYDFGIVILTTFFGTIVDKEPALTEHSEVRWVEASDLGGLPWAPADIPAVNRVVAHFAA